MKPYETGDFSRFAGDGEVRTLHGWCGSLLQKTTPLKL